MIFSLFVRAGIILLMDDHRTSTSPTRRHQQLECRNENMLPEVFQGEFRLSGCTNVCSSHVAVCGNYITFIVTVAVCAFVLFLGYPKCLTSMQPDKQSLASKLWSACETIADCSMGHYLGYKYRDERVRWVRVGDMVVVNSAC
jgi:hypothetical protein